LFCKILGDFKLNPCFYWVLPVMGFRCLK
jgi:hypothetical protein